MSQAYAGGILRTEIQGIKIHVELRAGQIGQPCRIPVGGAPIISHSSKSPSHIQSLGSDPGKGESTSGYGGAGTRKDKKGQPQKDTPALHLSPLAFGFHRSRPVVSLPSGETTDPPAEISKIKALVFLCQRFFCKIRNSFVSSASDAFRPPKGRI